MGLPRSESTSSDPCSPHMHTQSHTFAPFFIRLTPCSVYIGFRTCSSCQATTHRAPPVRHHVLLLSGTTCSSCQAPTHRLALTLPHSRAQPCTLLLSGNNPPACIDLAPFTCAVLHAPPVGHRPASLH